MAEASISSNQLRVMPAEWTSHERCIMGWPGRPEVWGALLEQARRDYAQVARMIAQFEPVLMLAKSDEADQARRFCGASVEVLAMPLDDAWLRDTGPLFVFTPEGVAAIDFRFNSWGGKYVPYEDDDALAARLCDHLGIPSFRAPLVLEGGAISVDGEGTLITTETAVLNPNRNPGWTRADVEQVFADYLGVEEVIWLKHGLLEDVDTDGHVDNVAMFVGPARVVCQLVSDRQDANFQRLKDNRDVLAAAVDARGRRLEVLEINHLPFVRQERRYPVPYLNWFLGNSCLIVPSIGEPSDGEVVAWLSDVFPDREVLLGPASAMAVGGGGIHCITQSQPSSPASSSPLTLTSRR